MLALKPLPGRILVELRDKYEYVATTDKKYDTKTCGICIKSASLIALYSSLPLGVSETYDNGIDSLEGKLVFWEEYKDGAVIERGGKKYAFIKIVDLDGYEDVEGK